jgi:DNA-binding NarL/FixJ family response regulator/anti-sigma regulatory factor (Ser/Thr protein kinase)
MFGHELLHVQTKDGLIDAYEILPYQEWSIPVREFLVDFIFRRRAQGAAEQPGSMLVIDDEPMTRELVASLFQEAFPDRKTLQASSAEEALLLLSKYSCAIVLTDIVMQGISGIELTYLLKKQSPSQIIIGISGYASSSVICDFIRAGGYSFVQKPLNPEELVQVVAMAITHPEGDLIRQQLTQMCDDAVTLWAALHEVARKMDGILYSVGSGHDVARDLLRHKAKHLVNDWVAQLGPGIDPVGQLQNLTTRLSCVERLARIVGQLGINKLSAFLGMLITDLRRVHPKVEFILEDNVGDEVSEVHFDGVVILSIAELIDNAVAAVGERGRVEIEIETLAAAGMLQIAVRDSGPGVPRDLENSIFEEGTSTKGAGRGLGLHLVRESLRSLRGTIDYSRQETPMFSVRIPLTGPR